MPKGQALPFPEAIEVERGTDPLPEIADSPSGRLRRRLLHGEKLGNHQAAALVGSKPGLLYAVRSMMEQWGFEFATEQGEIEKVTWVKNPTHIPQTKVQKQTTPRKKKVPEAAAAPAGGFEDRGVRIQDPESARAKMIGLLLDGEHLSGPQVREMFKCDPSNLRKAIASIEKAGYQVEKVAGTHPVKYAVIGKAKKPRGKALARRDEPEIVPISLPFGQQAPFGAVPAVPSPQLDQILQVYLVFRDHKTGDVKVGVRNGTVSWLCAVEGHVNDEDLAHAVASTF